MKNIISALIILFIPVLVSGATLSVSPSSQSVTVGSTFTVSLNIDTQGSSIDGTDIRYLNYDPTILQVEDSNANVQGLQITTGTLMPLTLANLADNNTGKIIFSQVTSGGNSYNGSGTLATITFRAVRNGTADLSFNYVSGNTTDSNVASNGVDILTSVVNGSYQVTSGSSGGSGGGSSSGGGGGGSSSGGSSSSGGGSSGGGGGAVSSGSSGSSSGGTVVIPPISAIPPVCVSISSLKPITSVVGLGSTGENVTNLQKFLAEKGYTSSIYITGYFGPLTQSALQKFQSDEGIVSSGDPVSTGYGNAGPSTRSRINAIISNLQSSNCISNPIVSGSPQINSPVQTQYQGKLISSNLGRGSTGEEVKILQQFLVGQGYATSNSVTGYFGPITEDAVKAFQRFQSIVSSGSPETTGYGNVGPSTRSRINAILGSVEGNVASTQTTGTSSSLETLQSQIQMLQAQVAELLKQLQQSL